MANSCGKARDFFGVVQRIYTIFANSTKRWKILKHNVAGLTFKSLSCTRWESRVESVKAIIFHNTNLREALFQVAEIDLDSKIRSEAKSLAMNELGDFEFLMALIIWYDILSAVNLVSKHLQEKDMLIDVAIKKVKGLISFFEKYRESGFFDAIDTAKNIAIDLNIDPVFPKRREIGRKKHFDENSNDDGATLSEEESFRVNYFLYIVDHAILLSLKGLNNTNNTNIYFGFLFTWGKIYSFDNNTLKSCCVNLENAHKSGEQSDIDGNESFWELKLLKEVFPNEKMGPIDVLRFLRDVACFPNVMIAYRILLTISVTVASVERSFSKLKLLKSYLHSTMSQDRLNGLAMIAIKNEILEKIGYEELIDDFSSKNARRVAIFKYNFYVVD